MRGAAYIVLVLLAGLSLSSATNSGNCTLDVLCFFGTCYDINGESTCTCYPGYTGQYCDLSIDMCNSSPCLNNANCTALSFGRFQCSCPPGYTGYQCQTDIDECLSNPCVHGTCTDQINGYTCSCDIGYSGQDCDMNINDCVECSNGGTCEDLINDYYCHCADGYGGRRCELPSNCPPGVTCNNNGVCSDNISCTCLTGFTGSNCDTNINECLSSPCNNGTCHDHIGSFTCDCSTGYTGLYCDTIIDQCVSSPCVNEGLCRPFVNGFDCFCRQGYTGEYCQININECLNVPCQNDAMCEDGVNTFTCHCRDGYYGNLCQFSSCSDGPCHNGGTCNVNGSSYTCTCPPGYSGINCTVITNPCYSGPCTNGGTCLYQDNDDYTCMCTPGYTGRDCAMNINECNDSPCRNNGTCIDGVNEYHCTCLPEYTGENCQMMIEVDQCISNPCPLDSTCYSNGTHYTCICPPLYTGEDCSVYISPCESDPCLNGATCNDGIGNQFTCTCPAGYHGDQCQDEINECLSNPCLNNGTCYDVINGYYCSCTGEYTGTDCETIIVTTCSDVSCQNDGICVDRISGFECMCSNGYTGLYCQVDIDECTSNPCLNNGTCIDGIGNYTCDCMEGYDGRHCSVDIDLCDPYPCLNNAVCIHDNDTVTCVCPSGYQGVLCEEKSIIDCNDHPCSNNGTCIDTGSGFSSGSGVGSDTGPSFFCQCPPGYTGLTCDTIIDQCNPSPCRNNATCIAGVNTFSCLCNPTHSGPLCESCNDTLCLNGGYCSIEEDGQVRCICAFGFTGPYCKEDIDDCMEDPCLNGGICEDLIGSYLCHCSYGFTGDNCEVNIDDCHGVNCSGNGVCIDDIGSYSCNCTSGWTGTHCEEMIDECDSVNCTNGGTCIDLLNGFRCDCPPGYTDTYCQTDIDECLSINCNNGTCIDLIDDYRCDCIPGYTGLFCNEMINDCIGDPCTNGGTCVDLLNDYRCECIPGYTGRYCETNINDCQGVTCSDRGVCEDLVNGYYCNCTLGYTGGDCETDIDDCASTPCNNGGTCTDGINNFTCTCNALYTGRYCEEVIDLCTPVNPCLNNGTCHPGALEGHPAYTCICVPPYNGNSCQFRDLCLLNPCLNNGTCIAHLTDGTYNCTCNGHYYGTNCTLYDHCSSSPCLNGGTCTNTVSSFVCTCPVNYTGNDCNTAVTPCTINPCHNGGTCTSKGDLYTCECNIGHTGINCTQVINSSTPYFRGDSYTLVPYSPSFSNTTLVELSLLSYSNNGLILYTSDEDHSSYFTLTISNGLLSLAIKQEGVIVDCIASYHPVSDGRWHSVSVLQDGLNIQLIVDQYSNSTQLIDMSLVMQPEVTFIGGVNNYPSLPLDVGQSTGLVGHLNVTLQLGGENVHVINDAITGSNIEQRGLPDQCTPDTCTNGGICQEGERCLCPFGYKGETCEQDIDIRIPYFSNSSYLILSNISSSNYMNIVLTLHSTTPSNEPSNKLLLLSYDTSAHSSDYFSLSLQNGTSLIIRYQLMNNSYSHKYSTNISTGEWHIITILYNNTGLYIGDNGITTILSNTSVLTRLSLTSPLFLGGLPNGLSVPFNVTSDHFNGCIRDVQFNNATYNLAEDSYYGLNLSECPQSICTLIQCRNGGICQESGAGFICVCPHGYSGSYCEIAGPLCSPSPCLFGGVCRELDDRMFVCDCPLGRHGVLCEEGLTITIPSFANSSYISYPTLSRVQSTLSITIVFRPSQPNGLLLFNAFSNTDFADYISIAVVNSHVVYRYNLGSGQAELISGEAVLLGQWHSVTVNRTGRIGYLQVNTQPIVSGSSPGPFTGLNIAGDMFLGGIPQSIGSISRYTGSSNGLTGCISTVIVNGVQLELISGAETGYSIGQCNTSTCNDTTCLNGGTCIESGNSFTCTCMEGYGGPLCGVLNRPCLSNPCTNGGTCTDGIVEGNFTCLCALGYGGDTCNDNLMVTLPSFNTLSYQRYPSPSSITLVTSITLTFHTSSLNGLLLYIGNSTRSRDFLSISLINGRVELRYDLGSGVAIISSNYSIQLNNWYTISVTRTRQAGSLSIGGVTFSGRSPGTSSLLNAIGDLYIGGGEDYSHVSSNVGIMTGMIGCIHTETIQINGLSLDPLQSSRGVTQCTVSQCASSPCMNGGTCTSNGLSFVCLCSLGYEGDTCERVSSITVPSFTGHSYLSHPSLTNSISITQLHIELFPNTSNGLILYNQQSNSGSDYIAVYLKQGHIIFQYDLGSGPAIITSTTTLSIGQWYNISVQRSGPNGQLIINNELPVRGSSPGSSTSLQLGGPLYIGGHSNLPLNITQGLVGCIRMVNIFQTNIDLINDAINGAGISQCTVHVGDECIVNNCLNGGQCVINVTREETCVCSLPYTGGEYCQERVSFSSAYFNRTSYLKFPLDSIPIHSITIHTEIRLSFIPASLTGLLFYIGYNSPSSGNYMMVGLNEGRIEYRYQLGSGLAVLTTNQSIVLGQLYNITLLRTDYRGRLLVSTGEIVNGNSPGTSRHLNLSPYDFVLYLGGAPDIPFISQQVYTTGFTGCFPLPVHLGHPGNSLPISFDTSLVGQNVIPCTS